MEKGAGIINICDTLVLLIVFLLAKDLAGHVVKLLYYHLRPFQPKGLQVSIGIAFQRHPPRTLLKTVTDETVQLVLICAFEESAVEILECSPGCWFVFQQLRQKVTLDLPVDLALLHQRQNRLSLVGAALALHLN